MAADINNTALQGASFIGGVAVGGRWGEHKQARGWMGGGISRENKPFGALMETLSLATAHVKASVCLQHGLCGSHFSVNVIKQLGEDNFISISKIQAGIKWLQPLKAAIASQCVWMCFMCF